MLLVLMNLAMPDLGPVGSEVESRAVLVIVASGTLIRRLGEITRVDFGLANMPLAGAMTVLAAHVDEHRTVAHRDEPTGQAVARGVTTLAIGIGLGPVLLQRFPRLGMARLVPGLGLRFMAIAAGLGPGHGEIVGHVPRQVGTERGIGGGDIAAAKLFAKLCDIGHLSLVVRKVIVELDDTARPTLFHAGRGIEFRQELALPSGGKDK